MAHVPCFSGSRVGRVTRFTCVTFTFDLELCISLGLLDVTDCVHDIVHLKDHGKPRMMLLDIVEVVQSHMGVVLGNTFVEVLKAFGIENKVSFSSVQKK